MNEQAQFFLNRISEKIDRGEFDNHITIPFINRNLIYASIKTRVNKRIETNANPLRTELEINEAIKDAKDVAVIAASIFLKCGIIKKTKEGFEFSRAWEKYLGLFQNYKYPQ